MFDFLSAVELNECGARLQLLVHVFNVFRAPVVPIIDHRDQKVLPRVLGIPPSVHQFWRQDLHPMQVVVIGSANSSKLSG